MATNPIINADVPDIAIVRVGNNYYMSSTTMHMNPGVPIMKSTDLVNWEMVNYGYSTLASTDGLNLANGKQEYGHGSWASSIRYQNGTYYVSTFSSSTGKTYIYKTANIEGGTWTVSVLNAAYHDCNLFFDDDGRVYLIYGQGDIKIIELTADASAIKSGGTNKTLVTNAGAVAGPIGLNAEGSQVVKHNGYYYINNICWPSGGMRTQIVSRSSSLTGTYESKVILKDQGVAQGSFIDTPGGKWYAYLFKDGGARGRVPYLVPMTWTNDWPVLSAVPATLDIPKGTGGMHNIVSSDEFSQTPPLKLAWQWNHNPQNSYWSLTQKSGYLRLTNERTDPNVLMTTNTLTQRTFGPQCSGYTAIDVSGMKDGDYAGLVALQKQYGYVGVKMTGTTKSIVMVNGSDVTGTPTQVTSVPLNQTTVYLRIDMDYRNQTDKAYFYYSLNGTTWISIGSTLQMSYTIPQFIGYRYGLFTYASTSAGGYADFDFFRIGATIAEAQNVVTPPAATITVTTPTTFCSGGSVVLNANTGAGYSYVWKNGTTTITGAINASYTATQTGSYTVAITSNGQTSTSAPTTVTVNALPVISPYAQIDGGTWNQVSTAMVCSGSTIVLGPQPTVATGWSWTGPNGYSATIREIPLSALTANQGGVYTASYTDGNTCKASSTFTLTVNALPTAAITTTTPTTFCTGGSVILTASTGSSYVWKNGTTQVGTTQTYTATTAGNYTVEVTNSNNCKATSAATTVTVNALPTATITTTTSTTFCTGGSVVLTASASSSYVWKNGTTQVGTTQTYTATTAGNYTVEITNASNCKATSAATTVTVNAAPTATIITTTPTAFCTGGNVVLTASAGSSYKWMNGTTQVGTAQAYTASTAGSYTVEVTNASNCKATSEATTVTVNAAPTATITTTTPTAFCTGGNVVLTASAGSSYKWLNGTTQVGTSSTYTSTAAGSYTVEVTNASNCKATSAATTVTVSALPTATITTTTPTAFCTGGNVVLTTSAGSSYKWMNGTAQVGTAQSYTATTAGSFTVEVTNASNCKATSTATTVTVNALPTATITANGPTTFIQGGSVELTASAGSSYKWFNGTTQVGTGASYTATTAGNYTVEVTNANNCAATSAATTVTISTANQPSLITITSPTANATVTGAIDIAVNVTDPDGSITLVEFLDGNTVIGTSTTAPYTFIWDNPSVGSHSITVRVTDGNGGITTSAPTVVTSAPVSTGVQSSNTLNASIYPNPSNTDIYIDTDVDLTNASFTLIDVLGREVTVSSVVTGSGARIDVSHLSEGTYVMIIKQDNSVMRKKITVIR